MDARQGRFEWARRWAAYIRGWSVAPAVRTQPDAGDVSIAVTLIARWEEFVDTLSPNFQMDGEKALARVIPRTSFLEEALVSRLTVNAGLNFGAGTSHDDKPAHPAPAGDGKDAAADKKNKSAGGASAGPQDHTKDAAPAEQPANVPAPAVSKKDAAAVAPDGRALPIDPMLAYAAATAFYQEIQFLNRYVSEAALRSGYQAYVIRIQISVVPFARRLPYDVYTNISFFPFWETRDGADSTQLQRERAEIIPLLVTDNLESVIKSRSSETVRQIILSLEASQGVGKGRAGVTGSRDRSEHTLGSDLNSLLTVGRISDNTIQVRLGAERSSAEYGVIPRTHNITVLALIPLSHLTFKERNFRSMIRLLSNTVWRDVSTGARLEQQTPRDRLWRVQELLNDAGFPLEQQYDLANELLNCVFANDVPAFEKRFGQARLCRFLRGVGLPGEFTQEAAAKVLQAYGPQQFWSKMRELAGRLDVAGDAADGIVEGVDQASIDSASDQFRWLLTRSTSSAGYLRTLWAGLVRTDANFQPQRLARIEGALRATRVPERIRQEFARDLLFAVYMNDYPRFEDLFKDAFLEAVIEEKIDAERRHSFVRLLWSEAVEARKNSNEHQRTAARNILHQFEMSRLADDLEELLYWAASSDYAGFEELLAKRNVVAVFLQTHWSALKKDAIPIYRRVVVDRLKRLQISVEHGVGGAEEFIITEFEEFERFAFANDLPTSLYRSLWSQFRELQAPEEARLNAHLNQVGVGSGFRKCLDSEDIESFHRFNSLFKDELFKSRLHALSLPDNYIKGLWLSVIASRVGSPDERLERVRDIVAWFRIPAADRNETEHKLFDAAVADNYAQFEECISVALDDTMANASYRRELWAEFARGRQWDGSGRQRIERLLRCLSVAPKNESEARDRLLYAIEDNSKERFQAEMDKYIPPTRFARDFWSDIVETLGASEYSGVRVELPPSERALPVQHQDILVVDNGDEMTVFLQGGVDLYEDRMSAILRLKTRKRGFLAIRSRKIEFGKKYPGLLITFPSMSSWGVIDEIYLKPDHRLEEAALLVSHSTKDKWNPLSEIKRRYEPVSYVRDKGRKKESDGSPIVVAQ